MEYIVREKIFSLTNNFNIRDKYENPYFLVESEFWTIGRKIRIYDLEGNELIYIEQVIFRLFPEYNIYLDGTPVMNVKQNFALFVPSFTIDSPLGKFELSGSVTKHYFYILKDGRKICTINKKFISFSDTYTVDIEDVEENHPLILALAIVLDQIYHDNNSD